MVQNAILGKNFDKAVFGSDLAKLKQETISIRSRMLSKEEIDFLMPMALAFHDLPREKSDQLFSLLGEKVKRCMDPTFHVNFKKKDVSRIT